MMVESLAFVPLGLDQISGWSFRPDLLRPSPKRVYPIASGQPKKPDGVPRGGPASPTPLSRLSDKAGRAVAFLAELELELGLECLADRPLGDQAALDLGA